MLDQHLKHLKKHRTTIGFLIFGRLWAANLTILVHLETILSLKRPILEHVLAHLGPLWPRLAPLSAHLEPQEAHLGPLLAHLGRFLAQL